MKSLFDMESVKLDSPRMVLLKKYDIQTHHAPHCEEPWIAVPMKRAREFAKGYDFEEKLESPADVCASFGSVLEDFSLIFFGQSKEEVENAALARCERGNG